MLIYIINLTVLYEGNYLSNYFTLFLQRTYASYLHLGPASTLYVSHLLTCSIFFPFFPFFLLPSLFVRFMLHLDQVGGPPQSLYFALKERLWSSSFDLTRAYSIASFPTA